MQLAVRHWTADDLATLSQATEHDPFGGLASPVQCLARSYLVELLDDAGRPFGMLAIEPRTLDKGAELQIIAGVRTGPGPQMPEVLQTLEQWAADRGADVLTFVTSRKPVERLAHRAGWTTTGAVVMRRLTPEH